MGNVETVVTSNCKVLSLHTMIQHIALVAYPGTKCGTLLTELTRRAFLFSFSYAAGNATLLERLELLML